MYKPVEIDPGYAWFRDWYHQFRNPYTAVKHLRPGQIVCQFATHNLPPKSQTFLRSLGFDIARPGRKYIILDIVASCRIAWLYPEDGIGDMIKIQIRDLCFPGNMFYALDLEEEEEAANLNAAIADGALERLKDITQAKLLPRSTEKPDA